MTAALDLQRQRAWALFTVSMTIAVCGTAWMIAAWDEVTFGNGVTVDREEEKSPEEIKEYWTPERMREAEPAEMPVLSDCEGVPAAFDPDCW